jgi:niacin transporter
MMNESGRFPTVTITGTALLLALGVVLPIVFHAIPLGGRIFLPMHLPTFVAGLILGPLAGLVVGAGSPVLSALLTGRPTVFYMIPMVLELATYGLVAGILRRKFDAVRKGTGAAAAAEQAGEERTGRAAPWTSVTLALVFAMVAGRIVWTATVVWLAPVIGLKARTIAMALGAMGAGWVGMIIQLALIPPIVRAIERVRET